MKKLTITAVLLGFCLSSFAQTNTSPANRFAGIGTTSPLQALDVRGNAFVSGKLTSSISGVDIGSHLELLNFSKIANGTASNWAIYNMGGAYGNSVQFWAYDNIGCASGDVHEPLYHHG